MCIFAFLYNAKDLMTNYTQVKFVLYLHNNFSTLESTNSVLRFRTCNRDTSQLIEKGLISCNISASRKLIKTKSYSKDDGPAGNKTLCSSEFDVIAGSKLRDSWFEALIDIRGRNTDGSIEPDECKVSIFPKSLNPQDSPNNQCLIFLLEIKKIKLFFFYITSR